MNPNDVILILERIAEMLTPGAQQAWEIAMKQVAVQASINHTFMWIGIVLFAIGIVIFIAGASNKYGGEGWVIFGTMVWLLGFAIGAGCYIAYFQAVRNPEYQAIKILLDLMGR